MKQHKGFTLLELMITIAIIGIVASIAIPSYTGYMTTARLAEAKNNIGALKLAEEEFFLEQNTYFGGTDAGDINTKSGGLWTVTGGDAGVSFDYEITASTTGYIIKATGKAGTPVFGKIEEYTK